jgi:DNA mismatch repair protein MutL
MPKIHKLPPELVSQIAAGEVIERPASAVKELLENSLDAGATRVLIELEEGGLKKIRVMDNGVGMNPEDAHLAFERHATSKLSSLEDLFNIRTLGFRGEALASIASIAKVRLKTRTKEDRLGTFLEVDGSRLVADEACAMEPGTDLSILGLFHHTPARRKYMKTSRTETQHCMDWLVSMALVRPDVAFTVKEDEKVLWDLPPDQPILERVRSLFGNDTAQAMIPVQFHQSNLLIEGFVGKPELSRSSKKYQFLFVNGRSIENRFISHAVKEAFHSLLMHEKHPWFLLKITMDPEQVDVNVHPRKLEVKFVNQQEVYRAVFGMVHHALQHQALSPIFHGEGEAPRPSSFTQNSSVFPAFSAPSSAPVSLAPPPSFDLQMQRLQPLAQMGRSYILAEGEEGLVLIDQHAAHERVRYAKFMEALERQEKKSQPLLIPLELDAGLEGHRMLEENLADFEAIGFELEPFGGSTWLIRAIPAGLDHREPERILRDMLAEAASELKGNPLKELREALLTMTACRGAIKFGDSLTMDEMHALLRDMQNTEHCSHCPHGRPAMITLTFDELETLFKRKNF